MKKISVQINSKNEMDRYLDSLDFDMLKDNKYDCVHFLVKYENDSKEIIEPVYFYNIDGDWFEGDCTLLEFEKSLEEYINFLYGEVDDKDNVIAKPLSFFEKELVEYEKQFQIGDTHYEIEHFQTFPFLPSYFEIIGILTEKECLEYLIKQKKENEKELSSFELTYPKVVQEKLLDYKRKKYSDPQNIEKYACELKTFIDTKEQHGIINPIQAKLLRDIYLY